MSARDGGTAFPSTDYYDERPVGESAGMSLRDYFAAHALTAVMAQSTGATSADIAAGCYALADALLAKRLVVTR